MGIAIRGTGHDLPSDVETNDHLAETTDDFDPGRSGCTLDQWVAEKIGVRSRHRADRVQTGTTAMAARACERALAMAGLSGADVDLIVLSTFTSDHRLPQSVAVLQDALGSSAKCIQLEAACMGFVDGVLVASSLLPALGGRTALVVHSETMSAVMDPSRFLLNAIFGDGAGAVVLRDEPGHSGALLAHTTATDGSKAFWLEAGGGTLSPVTADRLADGGHYMTFDHKRIYGFAVEKMVASCLEVLQAARHGVDDVDYVIAHQTGIGIIREVAARLGVDPARCLMTLADTGNTSGATIPIALDRFTRNGILQPGQRLLLPAVGAGMAWGALYVEWSCPSFAGAAVRQVDLDLREPVAVGA